MIERAVSTEERIIDHDYRSRQTTASPDPAKPSYVQFSCYSAIRPYFLETGEGSRDNQLFRNRSPINVNLPSQHTQGLNLGGWIHSQKV